MLWRPTRPFRTNTPKICPFHYRGLECKNRKSRDTEVTGKFGFGVQNEAGQRLTVFCQDALVITNTLFQQKRRLYTWTSPDGQQKSPKCSTWMQSQKWQKDLCSSPRQTIQYHSNPKSLPQPATLKKWSSHHGQQKSPKMQYLDAISKTTEWSLFISKANHSISQ